MHNLDRARAASTLLTTPTQRMFFRRFDSQFNCRGDIEMIACGVMAHEYAVACTMHGTLAFTVNKLPNMGRQAFFLIAKNWVFHDSSAELASAPTWLAARRCDTLPFLSYS